MRAALEKAGVDPNIIRIGKYKSAGEFVACVERLLRKPKLSALCWELVLHVQRIPLW